MLMIIDKNKIDEILPKLNETYGKGNVMLVNLVENGTIKL